MKKKRRFKVSIEDFQNRRQQIDLSRYLPTSYRIILLIDWIKILRWVFKESVQSIENALPTASTVDKAKNRANPAHAHLDEGVTHGQV